MVLFIMICGNEYGDDDDERDEVQILIVVMIITALLRHAWGRIKLLECPIPAPLSVSQKIRVTSLLAVFLKHGHMDFSKASNSISRHLTSIFPENCQIFRFFGWVGWVKRVDYLRGSCGLSARRARRTKSRPEGPQTRSRGPEGP